ncbi:hypothetical protein BJX68DRAFT_23588 [Aspergillus pseudodeflectus]|uniref:Uncharacterized protein n=1 Tax=Aspergillus pseudodeflectus TaxID=176178 RepID=A0ABR4KTR5_9EURO
MWQLSPQGVGCRTQVRLHGDNDNREVARRQRARTTITGKGGLRALQGRTGGYPTSQQGGGTNSQSRARKFRR